MKTRTKYDQAIEFEKRIERVFRSIENDSNRIEWNAVECDPHTGENRQIDIKLIRSNGQVTHIECRNRQIPQNVQWIEELIGRKMSLGADKIVAVSSSGFTKNAIEKGSAFGVAMFDLESISRGNLLVVTDPPDIFIRTIDNCEFKIWASSIGLSPSEITKQFNEKFGEIAVNISKILNRRGIQGPETVTDVSKSNMLHFDDSFTLPFGGGEITVLVKGYAIAGWEKLKLTPYLFRKLEPGVTKILSSVVDASLPELRVEMIISKSRVLFQIEFSSVDFDDREPWSNRTYCTSCIIAHESLGDRRVVFRHRGVPAPNFKFSLNVI